MIRSYNATFSDGAFKDHFYTFGEYNYKLRLEYISPNQLEENLKWALVIEGIANEKEIPISKIGNITEDTILRILNNNLEGFCDIPNSSVFANEILSNILDLTRMYSAKKIGPKGQV